MGYCLDNSASHLSLMVQLYIIPSEGFQGIALGVNVWWEISGEMSGGNVGDTKILYFCLHVSLVICNGIRTFFLGHFHR